MTPVRLRRTLRPTIGDMGSNALNRARDKMADAGVDPVAIDVFAHYFRLLEHGETGMIPESAIDPHDMESLADVDVPDDVAVEALGTTAVIKLNGGLGTSMGMDRAKSLLCVRRGLSFLDIIARQVLFLREKHDVRLPLIFMNSFRTSADTMAALARYEASPSTDCRWSSCRTRSPSCWSRTSRRRRTPRTPTSSGARPATATSTPRCSAPACSTSSSTPGSPRRSSRTPTTSAPSRTRGSPAGSPPPVRRSRSRPPAVPPATARAATSPAARATAGSSCARPRRRCPRTSTPSATSSGTATPAPTTSGSTCARCATP